MEPSDIEARTLVVIARLDSVALQLKRIIADMQDDPIHHMHTCKCGRAGTRQGPCGICESETRRVTP